MLLVCVCGGAAAGANQSEEQLRALRARIEALQTDLNETRGERNEAVNPDGWSRDPFGGELTDGEVWGRGAVDMLNLTASMAVAFRHLADRGFRPKGDLIYFAVADEESGSAHGARWVADHAADAIRADYVLTENGGLHSGPAEQPFVGINVGEKGVAWRKLRVRGVPGHGSMPYKTDNALVTAAGVIQRLAAYRPAPRERSDLGTFPIRALHHCSTRRARRCGPMYVAQHRAEPAGRARRFRCLVPSPAPGRRQDEAEFRSQPRPARSPRRPATAGSARGTPPS